MRVAVVKYNAGNVQSVLYALQRLGVEPVYTDNPETLRGADKVIFPGQGEAWSAMNYLKQMKLDLLIPTLEQPFLGICIGLQLMCKYSEEGDTPCLGIFDLKVRRFQDTKGEYKIPHMGWNNLEVSDVSIFSGLKNPYLYYVHSYFAELGVETVGKTEYILPFSGALRKDNFYAVQAHPEKSSIQGQQILANFLNL